MVASPSRAWTTARVSYQYFCPVCKKCLLTCAPGAAFPSDVSRARRGSTRASFASRAHTTRSTHRRRHALGLVRRHQGGGAFPRQPRQPRGGHARSPRGGRRRFARRPSDDDVAAARRRAEPRSPRRRGRERARGATRNAAARTTRPRRRGRPPQPARARRLPREHTRRRGRGGRVAPGSRRRRREVGDARVGRDDAKNAVGGGGIDALPPTTTKGTRRGRGGRRRGRARDTAGDSENVGRAFAAAGVAARGVENAAGRVFREPGRRAPDQAAPDRDRRRCGDARGGNRRERHGWRKRDTAGVVFRGAGTTREVRRRGGARRAAGDGDTRGRGRASRGARAGENGGGRVEERREVTVSTFSRHSVDDDESDHRTSFVLLATSYSNRLRDTVTYPRPAPSAPPSPRSRTTPCASRPCRRS